MRPEFVNRGDEMQRFLDWRAVGQRLLVSVTGQEGIGKTTFAEYACQEVAEYYPAAQLHYDMRGSEPQSKVTAEQAAEYFLGELGVARKHIPKSPAQRFGMLRSRLADRRVLLLLDDVQDVGQVKDLLFESDQALVMVTSRRPLADLRRVGFKELPLKKFGGDSARDLVATIAGVPVDDQVVDRLCLLCDGLPLALSIAAVRLAEEGPDCLEDLVRGKTFQALSIDGKPIVEQIFDASYRALDPDLARVYTLLSLVPGPHFGVGVAATVLEQEEAAVRRLLNGLVRRYVLEDYGNGRFRFHSLVRQHATDRAVSDLSTAEITDAVTRAVGWYWHRLVALDNTVARRPVPPPVTTHYQAIGRAYLGEDAVTKAFAELDVEWPNLVAAAGALPGSEFTGLFPLAMWTYGYATRRFPELVDAFNAALLVAQNDIWRWHLYRDLVATLEGMGDFDGVDEQMAHAFRIDYPAGLESLHAWYGLSYEGRQTYSKALEQFDEALKAIQYIPDPFHQERAAVLLSMHSGRVLCHMGELDQAELDQAEPKLASAYEYFLARPDEEVNQGRAGMWLGRVRQLRGQGSALLREIHVLLRSLGMDEEAELVARWLASEDQ